MVYAETVILCLRDAAMNFASKSHVSVLQALRYAIATDPEVMKDVHVRCMMAVSLVNSAISKADLSEAKSIIDTLEPLEQHHPYVYLMAADVFLAMFDVARGKALLEKAQSCVESIGTSRRPFKYPHTDRWIVLTKQPNYSEVLTLLQERLKICENAAIAKCSGLSCHALGYFQTIIYQHPRSYDLDGCVQLICNGRGCRLTFHPKCWKACKRAFHSDASSNDETDEITNQDFINKYYLPCKQGCYSGTYSELFLYAPSGKEIEFVQKQQPRDDVTYDDVEATVYATENSDSTGAKKEESPVPPSPKNSALHDAISSFVEKTNAMMASPDTQKLVGYWTRVKLKSRPRVAVDRTVLNHMCHLVATGQRVGKIEDYMPKHVPQSSYRSAAAVPATRPAASTNRNIGIKQEATDSSEQFSYGHDDSLGGFDRGNQYVAPRCDNGRGRAAAGYESRSGFGDAVSSCRSNVELCAAPQRHHQQPSVSWPKSSQRQNWSTGIPNKNNRSNRFFAGSQSQSPASAETRRNDAQRFVQQAPASASCSAFHPSLQNQDFAAPNATHRDVPVICVSGFQPNVTASALDAFCRQYGFVISAKVEPFKPDCICSDVCRVTFKDPRSKYSILDQPGVQSTHRINNQPVYVCVDQPQLSFVLYLHNIPRFVSAKDVLDHFNSCGVAVAVELCLAVDHHCDLDFIKAEFVSEQIRQRVLAKGQIESEVDGRRFCVPIKSYPPARALSTAPMLAPQQRRRSPSVRKQRSPSRLPHRSSEYRRGSHHRESGAASRYRERRRSSDRSEDRKRNVVRGSHRSRSRERSRHVSSASRRHY